MAKSAEQLERRILAGLADAQDAYEEFVSIEGWRERGFDSFGDWWAGVVVPTMRSLSMRPTREIAAKVIERVREEERALPSAQRRSARELGDLVGQDRRTVSGWRPPQDRDDVQDVPHPDLADEEQPIRDPLPPEISEQIQQRIATRRAQTLDDEDADEIEAAQGALDESMSETAVRFRRNFSAAMRRAGEICSFEPERVAEVYATDYEASVERSFFASLERFIDKVREARRRQTSGLRIVKGGRAS